MRLLNQAILELAPRGWRASSYAPSTLAGLRLCDAAGLVVWDGASDGTIYGDARVNHAFRAWHDKHHWTDGYSFDLAGERAACEAQIRELETRYPRVEAWAKRIIRTEIVGQAEYFAAHGFFPVDQLEVHR